jgi:hypothetical protein
VEPPATTRERLLSTFSAGAGAKGLAAAPNTRRRLITTFLQPGGGAALQRKIAAESLSGGGPEGERGAATGRAEGVRVTHPIGPAGFGVSLPVAARAFTVGNDIVFGVREYDPWGSEGRRLHTRQQQGALGLAGAPLGVSQPGDPSEREADRVADRVARGKRARPVKARRRAVVARAPYGFSAAYRNKAGKIASHEKVEYPKYKSQLGRTEESSLSGGHPLVAPLEKEELLEVFDGVARDLQDGSVSDEVIDDYVDELNQAFRLLKIDTVEAQGSFIANAYVESDQFRFLTETSKAGHTDPYTDDPSKVKLDTDWLDRAARKKADLKARRTIKKDVKDAVDYERGGSINTGDWQHGFIGRGPVQVTHRHNYIQAVAVLERRTEELEIENPSSPDLPPLLEAIAKIKKDPAEASNPRYGFLLSAAFMKLPRNPDTAGGKVERGDEKANRGLVTNWMGKQLAAPRKKKQKAYDAAVRVLMPRSDLEMAELAKAEIPSPALARSASEGP